MFARTMLPLNIFEPRYIAMVDDALKSDARMIGIIQARDGADNTMCDVGSAGRIIRFTETEDRRYEIVLFGITRFRIVELMPSFTPYIKATVDWQPYISDLTIHEDDPEFSRESFMKLLMRYFQSEGFKADMNELQSSREELLINSLAMAFQFSVEEKQALLEAPSLADRRRAIETLIEISLRGGQGDQTLQ